VLSSIATSADRGAPDVSARRKGNEAKLPEDQKEVFATAWGPPQPCDIPGWPLAACFDHRRIDGHG
jgi:hypothetical protein